MAEVNNKWVGYLDRPYQMVKAKLLGRLENNAPELTDHTENNPLVIIISMFAGVVEMLNYYIDNLGQEAFLESARKLTSVINLTRVLDYRIKTSAPEKVDIEFTLSDPAPVGGTVIPSGTQVQSSLGTTVFITTRAAELLEGETVTIGPAKQSQLAVPLIVGVTTGQADQTFTIPVSYEFGTSSVDINGVIYQEVDTFAYSRNDDNHYIVDVGADSIPFIKFGDGIKGIIPDVGFDVIFTYSITKGPAGAVGAGELTNILNAPTIPGVAIITSTNHLPSAGGVGIEGIESIKKNAPLSIRTLLRAVTYQDHKDLAESYPGVLHALVEFCCGKSIKIYIAPEAGPAGGIASESLLDDLEIYFDDLKMITTTIDAVPAGLTQTVLNMTVTPKFRRDPIQTQIDVEQALLEAYNYLPSSINRATRVSDILGLVDNLEKVDFANIIDLYTLPYPRPLLHGVPLFWDVQVVPTAKKAKYKITLNSNLQVLVSRDNKFIQVLGLGETYTDTNIIIGVNDSLLYQAGMEWIFEVFTYGIDQVVTDFTVPVLNGANLVVTVVPLELNQDNC